MGKNHLYNYLVSFTAAIGGLLFGYEIGVVSQVLGMKTFQTFFDVLNDEAMQSVVDGNVTFTFLGGCVIGAALVSYLADKIGRKWSIMAGSFFFSIGGMLQFMAQSFTMFYSGRILSGLGIGILSMVVPLFISEISPTEIRGRMITVQQLMITIGIVIAACINAIIIKTVTGEHEWRLALAVQVIPGVLLFILTIFLPYSPRWLIDRDRNSEALEIIARLRAEPTSSLIVLDEYQGMKDNIEYERHIGNGSYSDLLKPGIINRVAIAVTLQMLQQWTGINVILYYQSKLLMGMGFSEELVAIPLTIANDFINFLATFPGMYLVEKIGRRKLLIWGGYGMGISLLLTCILTNLAQAGSLSGWPAAISVYFFIVFFASTWGPVVWVYQSEIFPQRVRAKATGLATISNWTWNMVISKITPLIRDKIGANVYIIFGVMGLVMGTFSYAVVPETMGKSLEEMDGLFGSENHSEQLRDKKSFNSMRIA